MRRSLHAPPDQKLRSLLVKARLGAGLTQQALADRLGAHQSFISKYEQGERQLGLVEFLRVCRALGTSPEAITRAVEEELDRSE